MEKESWDEIEDSNRVSEIFKSKEFQEAFRKQVEKDTWGNDLPMIYMDDGGWIVRHYKDGKIERVQKIDSPFRKIS